MTNKKQGYVNEKLNTSLFLNKNIVNVVFPFDELKKRCAEAALTPSEQVVIDEYRKQKLEKRLEEVQKNAQDERDVEEVVGGLVAGVLGEVQAFHVSAISAEPKGQNLVDDVFQFILTDSSVKDLLDSTRDDLDTLTVLENIDRERDVDEASSLKMPEGELSNEFFDNVTKQNDPKYLRRWEEAVSKLSEETGENNDSDYDDAFQDARPTFEDDPELSNAINDLMFQVLQATNEFELCSTEMMRVLSDQKSTEKLQLEYVQIAQSFVQFIENNFAKLKIEQAMLRDGQEFDIQNFYKECQVFKELCASAKNYNMVNTANPMIGAGKMMRAREIALSIARNELLQKGFLKLVQYGFGSTATITMLEYTSPVILSGLEILFNASDASGLTKFLVEVTKDKKEAIGALMTYVGAKLMNKEELLNTIKVSQDYGGFTMELLNSALRGELPKKMQKRFWKTHMNMLLRAAFEEEKSLLTSLGRRGGRALLQST